MKKIISPKIKYCTAFLLLIVFTIISVICVSANETDGMIKGYYDLGDVEFSIYRIGDINSENEFEPEDEYSIYHINYSDDNFAQTFETYIKKDGLKSLSSAKTNSNGVFEFDNLENGVYLVLGKTSKVKEKTYNPVPTTVIISNKVKNAEVVVKSIIKLSDTRKDVSVLKIWEDNNSKNRPKEISVELLKDGETYQEVKLNTENNWQYKWNNLDSQYEWIVIEKDIPNGYTVNIVNDSNSFVITNKAETKEIISDNNNNSNNISTITNYGNIYEKLPQTGQMNLPIVILISAGLILIIIGIVKRKKSE